MKTSINSKKFTQSLLLMSILCMSLNIMAPDEELITNRETNSAELLAKTEAKENAAMDDAIEAARKKSQNSILESRTAEIAGKQKTIERSLWEKIKDAFKPRSWNNAAAAEDFLKTQTNQIGTQDHSFDFSSNIKASFRKLDTAQKTEVLQNSMEKACADLRDNLRNIKGDTLKTTAKNNFFEKITELKTAIEKGKTDGTGMLNPDQHLEILDSKGEIVSLEELKKLTNLGDITLGDITFRIRTDAQKTEETNKIKLEEAREKDRKNKDDNKRDAKQIKLNKENEKTDSLNKTKTIAEVSAKLIKDDFTPNQVDFIINSMYSETPSFTSINKFLNLINNEDTKNKIMSAFDGMKKETFNQKIDVLIKLNQNSPLKNNQTNRNPDAEQNIGNTKLNNTPESALSVTAFQPENQNAPQPEANDGSNQQQGINPENEFENNDQNSFNNLFKYFQNKKD